LVARRRPTRERRAPELPDAIEIALAFLGSRPRTRWEVDRRLRRAGCDDQTVDAALARLAELGYVDDAAFARWWEEQRDRHSPRGRRMLEAELRQRGVPASVIEAFREEQADPDRRPADETLPSSEAERAALALARHLRGRPLPDDARAVQRIGMYLMRRGFDTETVRSTIRNAGSDPDDQ
jgi:regulatory protein